MRPIDFLGNSLVDEIVFVTLEGKSLSVWQKSDYHKEKDGKWVGFCREHGLGKCESANPKWHRLYLDLCACGLL